MDIRLHPAGAGPGKSRCPLAPGRLAGLPARRFFVRFRSLADLPPEDLDFLSGQIRLALDVSREASITALHAAVRAEIRNRDSVPGDWTTDD